ncbi:MAG: hypothetical protein NUW07_07935 [Candidatus Saccharicenans sp.]|jgi:hypothetical protein|nr:hypothetical protein [Candidatus Saccharicenans sp.]MDH7492916.1 hypothetical protein [Candidatus Saccharicenans sp.]
MKRRENSNKLISLKPDKKPGKSSRVYRFGIYLFVLFFLMAGQVAARDSHSEDGLQEQPPASRPHFYNVDREVTIEGQVEDIKFESRYEGRASFLILMVKDKNSNDLVEVETAPAWFFRTDIHKGEKIKLVGSLAEDQREGRKLVIAREMRISNQTITLRDRRGFPAWRRGSAW